ncbi:MAG: TIGR02302 family protein, partial [Hansschlegelia sp.]
DAAETVRAPVGSMVVVRGSGGAVAVTPEGGVEPVETENRPPEGLTERRFKLTGDAGLKIAASGSPERVWRFAAIPDVPPSITIEGAPKQNARGTATVGYEVKDDFGVVSAEARFVLTPDPAAAPRRTTGDRGDAPPAKPRPLYEAPKIALGLPRAKAREGRAQTPLDTMEHPFAGAEATMTLYARDEAGQEGASAPVALRLPARSFTNPLARALVEQRRVLASDADSKARVLQALRALALYPEQFTPQAGVYLGLTTAYRRLEIAVSDDELRGAADYIWEVALRIEDGDLPDAERDLKAAEQALRKALEEGASEQEVAKLTQDLRQALEKFMREMAQQAQKQPQQPAQPGQKGAQAVTPKDLRDMVDRMEQLSKQGSKDAAKQALADLKNMLDNLKNAQSQPADPNAQAQQQQMDKLQDMIREQQKLRDKTFQQYRQNDRADRNQRQQGRQKQGDQGEQAMRDLEKQQQQLRDKLDQMMKEMGQGQQQGEQQPGQQQGEGQQKGQQPGKQGQGQQGEGQQPGQNELGQAGKSMGDAKGALGQGQTGEALDQQQKALESMRKGAQAMSESQGQGQPGQRGQQGEQGAENGEEGRDDDPLGRPTRRRESDGNTTKVPGQIEAERARKVLDELRRRLGESERSRDELDYLERLLTP